MRIWVIGRTVPEVKTGMMGLFEFEQATALQAYGESVEVCYLYADNCSVKVLRLLGKDCRIKEGIPVFGTALPVGGLPQRLFQPIKTHSLKQAMRICEQQHGKPDIIHIHFPLLTMTSTLWAQLRAYHVPLFVTEHWSKVQTKKIAPFRIRLLQQIVEEATAFITVGYPLRDSVRALTGTKRELLVIPNMVSNAFRPVASSVQTTEPFRFLTVGRLVPDKRFSVVIDAFTKAFRDQPMIQLTIAGGGKLEGALRQQIEQLHMGAQITMTGQLEHSAIAQLMQQCSCFVSASVLETFGVPFIEAWSCGKPILGVQPSSIEIYVTPQNGMLVPADDANALAAAMQEIYAHHSEYDATQIAAEAENRFSQRAVATELLQHYRSALEKTTEKT